MPSIMEESTKTSASAKLYFLIFIFACANAAPVQPKDDNTSSGSGEGHGISSLVAEITAVGPDGAGSASIDLNGGSWNSASGYMSQGSGYNYASGNTNGGSNAYGSGDGQSVIGSIDAQSQSGGSATYESEQSKKADELSVQSTGGVEANAGAQITGSATSGDGNVSSLTLSGGVGTGGNAWVNIPPPSGSQTGYTSSNGFIAGSGDSVEGSLNTNETLDPFSSSVAVNSQSGDK